MVNTLCVFIDKIEKLEREEGRLASIVGILALIVLFIAGLSLAILGVNIMLYSGVEIINKIFFK